MIKNYMHINNVINHICIGTNIVYIPIILIFNIHHYIVIILDMDARLLFSCMFLAYIILLLFCSIKIALVALVSYAFILIGINNNIIINIFFIFITKKLYEKKGQNSP